MQAISAMEMASIRAESMSCNSSCISYSWMYRCPISTSQCRNVSYQSVPPRRLIRSIGTSSSIFATAAETSENVEVEPAMSVEFPPTILSSGGSQPLSLIGTGFKEENISFICVKVYAIGVYIDASISTYLAAWRGKGVDELSKDLLFFKAVSEAPMEKGIMIVLLRDMEGARLWAGLYEALAPRLKDCNAGVAGQEALDAFGEVFWGRSLKQGTSICFTWIRPFYLQVAISADDLVPPILEASIVSAALAFALYDVYLGKSPWFSQAKASIAKSLSLLLLS